jgi:DNA-binding Lrp family transcriptional regulator
MVSAFVLLKVKSKKPEEIRKELCKIKAVKEAYAVYGAFDFIIKIEAKNPKTLKRIILHRLSKIPDIASTCTQIVIE